MCWKPYSPRAGMNLLVKVLIGTSTGWATVLPARGDEPDYVQHRLQQPAVLPARGDEPQKVRNQIPTSAHPSKEPEGSDQVVLF